MSKDVKELLRAALKAEGADGLVHYTGDCGCDGEGLLPYEECPDKHCESAEKRKCAECGRVIYWPTGSKTKPENRRCNECYYGN